MEQVRRGMGFDMKSRAAAWRTAWIWICSASVALAAPAADWPRWGGPQGDFTVVAGALAESWPEAGPPEIWSRELGGGNSSLVVDDKRVYTYTRRGDEELVLALSTIDGEVLWEHAYAAPPLEAQVKQFGIGPQTTPLLLSGNLYTLGFTGHLRCLEAETGKLRWSRDLRADFGAKAPKFGFSSSPVTRGDLLYVLVGGERYGAVGLALESGELKWHTSPLDFSYSTPIFVELAGEEQMVFMTPSEVVGVHLGSGEVRWRHPHANRFNTNCAGPWPLDDGRLLVSSQADAGGRILSFTKREGDIVVSQDSAQKKLKIFHNNALRRGDIVYAAVDAFLVAYDLEQGKELWRERGYPGANLLETGSQVVALDDEGRLSLIALSPEKVVQKASVQLLGKPSWTPPSLVGTRLYARDAKRLVVLELGAPEEPKAETAAP